MVYCQAFGCSNSSSKSKGKSFHRFPDPEKCRDLFKRWVALLNVEKFQGKNLKYDRKNDVVCSDHFAEADFIRDHRAQLMPGSQRRRSRLLKDGAVPSILENRPAPKSRQSTEKRIADAEAKRYIQSVLMETSNPERKEGPYNDQASTSQGTSFEHDTVSGLHKPLVSSEDEVEVYQYPPLPEIENLKDVQQTHTGKRKRKRKRKGSAVTKIIPLCRLPPLHVPDPWISRHGGKKSHPCVCCAQNQDRISRRIRGLYRLQAW